MKKEALQAACCELSDSKQAGLHQLVLYPRSHLDSSSVLASRRLPQKPECMDCLADHILLAYLPLTLHLIRVQRTSDGKQKGMSFSLQLTRELSMVSLARPLCAIGMVSHVCAMADMRDPFVGSDRCVAYHVSHPGAMTTTPMSSSPTADRFLGIQIVCDSAGGTPSAHQQPYIQVMVSRYTCDQ